jgi:hypothetical protein
MPNCEVVEPKTINPFSEEDERRLERNKYKRDYRARNPAYAERERQASRLWHRKNRKYHSLQASKWSKNNHKHYNELLRKAKKKYRINHPDKVFQESEIKLWIYTHSGYSNLLLRLWRRGMKPPRNFHMSYKKGVWWWTFAHP